MYAIRFSPNIQNDVQRGWSAWMGMRYASFIDLVNTAAEIDEYDYAEWAEARDLDTEDEATAEAYVTEKMGWDVRIDPATGEFCVVHHNGLSVYVVDEENLDANIEEATRLEEIDATATGEGHATRGSVAVIASFGWWHVLEIENAIRE